MNSHVKSFLLGLSGVLITYTAEWLASTDFGSLTPIVAAMTPVVVNALRLWLTKQSDPPQKPEELDVRVFNNPPRDPENGALDFDIHRGWFQMLLVAAILSLPSIACAQFTDGIAPPKLVVNGPTTGTPGEILTFDFSQTEGSDVRFRVVASPELKGYKQVYHDAPTVPRANIASFPGRYLIRIQAWNAAGIDEWERVIVVPGNPPCPQPEPLPIPDPPAPPVPVDPVTPPLPPGPGPTPIPKPILPPEPGRFALAPRVFEIASSVTSPTRIADCRKLASECQRIADTEWSTMTFMAAEIVKVLNSLPAGWQDLKTQTQTSIAGLYTAGQLKSREDLKALLLELKVAFERAAEVK